MVREAGKGRRRPINWDRLIDLGLEKGFLTYQELSLHFPPEMTSDEMEDLLNEIDRYDIDVVDEQDIKPK